MSRTDIFKGNYKRQIGIVFNLAIIAVLGFSIWTALGFESLQAKLFPVVIASVSLVLAVVELGRGLFRIQQEQARPVMDLAFDSDGEPSLLQSLRVLSWFIGFLAITILFGFPVSVPVFVFGYLLVEAKLGLLRSVAVSLAVTAFVVVFLGWVLALALPEGLLM